MLSCCGAPADLGEEIHVVEGRLDEINRRRFDDNAGPNLLVLADDVDPRAVLLQSALPDTIVVSYDSEEMEVADLIDLIKDAHLLLSQSKSGPKYFKHIGIAAHGGDESDDWHLAKDLVAPLGDSQITISKTEPLMKALVAALEQGGRIDLASCDLLSADPKLVDNLEHHYNVNFAASDDKTGNPRIGGDWIMESEAEHGHTIDISGVYFDKESLKEYNELMWGWPAAPSFGTVMNVVDCVPLVGVAARSGQAAVCLAKGDHEGAKAAAGAAALNAAGDALGLVTGGSGKAAMIAARTGAKILIKQGAKRAAVHVVKLGHKHISKKLSRKYAKKYFKKPIKKAVKNQFKKYIKEQKQIARDELEKELEEATGCSPNALRNASQAELNSLAESIAECPDDFLSDDVEVTYAEPAEEVVVMRHEVMYAEPA